MVNQTNPATIEDGVVVSMDYTLLVNGEVFETSPEGEPIQFIQGQGEIISGLENQIYGLKVGDQKEINVVAEDGYGEIDPDAYFDVAKDELPPDIPLVIGTMLEVQDEEGEEMDATISAIEEDSVELNFNHPLAGKDLTFKIRVTDLRTATEEELSHGHVHVEGMEEE